MPFIRLLALVTAIAVGLCVLMYVLTGKTHWRHRAWRIVSVAGVVVAIVLLLLLFEHLLGGA